MSNMSKDEYTNYITEWKDEPEYDESQLVKMTRKFLKGISKHKDVIMMENIISFLQKVPEYVENGWKNSVGPFQKIMGMIEKTLSTLLSGYTKTKDIADNSTNIMIKMRKEINKIVSQHYKKIEIWTEEMSKSVQEKIIQMYNSSDLKGKADVSLFIQKMMDIIMTQIRMKMDYYENQYVCKNKILCVASLEKKKNEILYNYGRLENFDNQVEMIIHKIKDSDPSDVRHLDIYLNHLNQSMHFMKIDILLEDILRNNKPVATKKSNLVVNGDHQVRIKQDVFANLGDVSNPHEYGENYLDPSGQSYHDVFRAYGQYTNESFLGQSEKIEGWLDSVLNSTATNNNKQVFLKKKYEFSNKPFPNNKTVL